MGQVIRETYDENLNEIIRLKTTDEGKIVFTSIKQGNGIDGIQSMQKPLFAHIRLTNKCNLNCQYCYTKDNSSTSDMSDEEIDKLIELCNSNGVMNITWTGGEPLLRSKFVDFIKKTNLYGINQTILTNGLLLDKIDLKSIPKQNLTFQISLNDVWKQSTDIDIIIQNAKRLINNKYSVIMSVMLISVEIDQVRKLLDQLIENNIPGIRFGLEIPIGGLKNMDMSIYENHMMNMMGKLLLLKKEYMNKIQIFYQFDKNIYSDTGIPRRFFMCEAGTTQIYIDNNGDVYPCPLFKGFKEFYCGNVFEKTWLELWNSKPMKQFRSVEECADCNYSCGVWCRAFIYNKNKSLKGTSPYCLKKIQG